MQFDLFDTAQSKILTAKNYPVFKQELIRSNCTKCELSKSRTHLVVDRGNPETKVLFIGEAPGENEDLQGRAFVGRAGKLLDGMMKEAGFDTDCDGLIVNVVKCRPPENRAPRPEEVGTCFPYLKKQIELVRPRIIVLLGATALRHVIPGKKEFSMGKEAGNFFEHAEYPGTSFMVLYHPAFILRDPRKRPLMEEHIRRFRDSWIQTVPRA